MQGLLKHFPDDFEQLPFDLAWAVLLDASACPMHALTCKSVGTFFTCFGLPESNFFEWEGLSI